MIANQLNKTLLLFCSIVLFSTSISTSILSAQATDLPNWDLLWHDEFDGTQLDTTKWDAIFSNLPTNNSLHAYRPSQITVADGKLVITSEDIPTGGLPHVSGQVISKVAQKRGHFVVRAKLPYSKGMWPAIWLLPDTQQYRWPSGGEIDLMENRGDEPFIVSSAFHWGTNPPYEHFYTDLPQQATTGAGPVNYHSGYHTFAVDWDEDQLRYYIDDVHFFTVFDDGTNGFISNTIAPMNMVLNTAIGGNYLDNPDATTVWPQQFLIDYSRSYVRSNDPYTQNFDNGGFEQNGGSLAHWTVFGNAIPNITTSSLHTSEGTEALKLFGPYNNNVSYTGVEQGKTVVGGQQLTLSADAFISSADSIVGTNNEVVLKIDYYSKPHGVFGSSDYISSSSIVLANSATGNNNWVTETLNSTVPANAVEARAAIVFIQRAFANGSVYIDNVQFTAASTLLPADAKKLLTGSDNGDSYLDTIDSDNIDYRLVPAATTNLQKQRIDLILLAETTTTSPSELSFIVEASMSGGPSGDVQQELRLFNRHSNSWESIDIIDASNGDSIHVSTATGDLSRFVHPTTGEVLARIIWSSTDFEAAPFDWTIDIDQAGWMIEAPGSRTSREAAPAKDGRGFKARTIKHGKPSR